MSTPRAAAIFRAIVSDHSRSASTTPVMLAGNWKTSRMVAHYSAGATAERGAVARYLFSALSSLMVSAKCLFHYPARHLLGEYTATYG